MKNCCLLFVLLSLLVVCVSSDLYGGVEKWEFSGVTRIRIKGISGDVVLRPAQGRTGLVELRENVRPSNSFRPEVEQDGATLYIREEWHGNTSRGDVEWTLFLPEQSEMINVRINNASGNLDCRNVFVQIDYETASGDVVLSEMRLGDGSDFNTASGDYIIEDMTITEDVGFHTASGDFELENLIIEEGCRFSSASGNVNCQYCTCKDDVEMSSASGDVIIRNTELQGWSTFGSASGDVSIHLDRLPEYDLSAGSASGRVDFQVDDFGDDFTLILIKREDKGRISCPFRYTDEETFEDYHVYEKKIVRRGSGRPEIELRTASGRVVVKD
jgi:DUF4097 and DUF4098 domain-containing protein YvlB